MIVYKDRNFECSTRIAAHIDSEIINTVRDCGVIVEASVDSLVMAQLVFAEVK